MEAYHYTVPAPAQRIRIWTGSRVHPLGVGLCSCGRKVHALALDTTGRCDRCEPCYLREQGVPL